MEKRESTDFYEWFDQLEQAMGEALRIPMKTQELVVDTLVDAAKTQAEATRPIPEPTWKSPNKVMLETDAFVLRQFSECPYQPPLLILPPQAGHSSHIADFDVPSQSLVHTCKTNGVWNLQVVEWKSATYARRHEVIDDLMIQTKQCVDFIGGKAMLAGLCQGGWQAAGFAARFPEMVDGLIIAGAPIDTKADGGKIQDAVNTHPFSFYEWLVALGGGLYRGEIQLFSFKMMNAVDRFFSDYVDLYQNINDAAYIERYRTFRDWYEYTQNISGDLYLQIVKDLFIENKLYNGDLTLLARRVNLRDIHCPVVLLAGKKDDITLANQVFNMEKKISSSKILKLLIDAGHIGLFMGKKALSDYWPTALNFLFRGKMCLTM